MKVIIAGSRTIGNPYHVNRAWIDSKFEITEVVSGTANGIDKVGEHVASQKMVPVKRFPAEWKTYGKQAGHIRNAQMAEYADALILVWDGQSRGSANMLKEANEKGLQIFEVIV